MFFILNAGNMEANGQAMFDIGLFNTDCGQFEVRLRPNENIQSGITNIQFTIRWPAGSVGLVDIESNYDVGKIFQDEDDGHNYAVFVGLPGENTELNWLAGQEYVIMRFNHDETSEGTADFVVADDDWAAENFVMFYAELWGMDATGAIYHQATDTYIGTCPIQIHIGLYETECARFEVRLKPDIDIEKGISNIQFAIKWPAGTVDLLDFESDFELDWQYVEDEGGYSYAVFVAVPLDDEVLDWGWGQEYVVLAFGHDQSGTGTGTFSIASDNWAEANNALYFTELYGSNFTGEIYHQAEDVQLGPCRAIDIRVFLEGPYNSDTGLMRTSLNELGLLPLSQPYNVAPWHYDGDEHVESFAADVVDWVLVELRDAATAEAAAAKTSFSKMALLLTGDGRLLSPDMILPGLDDGLEIEEGLFVVVRHRNHIDILSAAPLAFDEASNAYSVDLSASADKVFGGSAAYNLIDEGRSLHAMVAGDADGDGSILPADRLLFREGFGIADDYNEADYDMDGEVLPADRVIFRQNFGITTPF